MNQEEQYYLNVKSKMASICFFNESKFTPDLVPHGTMTFYKSKKGKVYGITNYHVYETYNDKKKADPSLRLQIGNFQVHDIDKRILNANPKLDLIVFELNGEELKKIGDKESFTSLACINDLHHKYKDQLADCSTAIHSAGFQDKRVYCTPGKLHADFDIFLSFAPLSSVGDDKFTIDFLKVRGEIQSGNKIPEIGELPNEGFDFGGMSGSPVFARIDSSPEELTLLGIIYEGSTKENSFEICFGRPITLLQHILEED